jgi:bla regulator protein BlaR1
VSIFKMLSEIPFISIILEMSITASVMIFVVAVIRRLFSRKMSPTVMLLLWSMVLVRLCLPFTFTSPIHLADLIPKKSEPMLQSMDYMTDYMVPEMEISKYEETQQNSQHGTNEESLDAKGLEDTSTRLQSNNKKQTLIVSFAKQLFESIPLWAILIGIWAFGAITIAMVFTQRIIRFRYKLSSCNPVIDKQIIQTITNHKSVLGINKRITVLECNFIRTPSVFGSFKPFLLLPYQFIHGMDGVNLSGILLHELCHIKRRDML